MVDLRSDTVTQPTEAMRRAMASAEVGDDVYGEDPTVNRLEEAFADRLGMGAALFVPSGTMANQIALRLLYQPGTVAVAGRRQHVVIYEGAASARNSGVAFLEVDDTGGGWDPVWVQWAKDSAQHHQPRPSVACVENTHMASGGLIWDIEDLARLSPSDTGVALHMDGARLFNAEVATGVAASSWAKLATTVMCCLSKGLCAPVGSLLAGPVDLVGEARAERSRLGGSMRQAGIVAAAGLVALDAMVDRLSEDHVRANRLAEGVGARWDVMGASNGAVASNMVVFPHPDTDGLERHMRGSGVLVGTIAPGIVRLVTHADVDDAGIERALRALSEAP